jgi:hypothetical protein
MNSEARKYLDTELDLSKLRLSSLEESKTLSDVAKKRLIDIEDEFQNLDFDSLNIDTLSDAMTAVRLYRSSRKNFSNLYINKAKDVVNSFESFLAKEITLNIENKKSVELKYNIRRAAIALCLNDIFIALRTKVKDDDVAIEMIYNLICESRESIFSLYNDSLNHFMVNLKKDFKKDIKIQPLTVLLSDSVYDDRYFNLREVPFYGKNTVGIILPTKSCGRETLWVVSKKIKLFNNDITELFNDDVSNVFLDGEYHKAILFKNKNNIQNSRVLLSKYYFVMSLFFQNTLSKRETKSIKIDPDGSKILVPSSRTEDQALKLISNDFFSDAINILKNK